MKVLNVIWAFGTGGIGKLFLTYAALGEYDSNCRFLLCALTYRIVSMTENL